MTRNAGINLPGTDPSRGRQGRWLWIVLGVALVVGATALALGRHEGPSPARAPSPTCSGAFDLGPDVGGLSLPYCANRSLTATDAGVRRLVVVIHGD
ncbi:MAG TPA: hypothetical protein VM451_05445, partial [Candidatus Limnocylindria bacterium]|nr:hypothetical protein [Candidatus Limnocylindria bacterium]